MRTEKKQSITRQSLYWGLSGVLFVWMWFRPIFWNMTEVRDSTWTAWWDIFIWPSTPEYMLGAGVDQLGTFWIFGSLPEILQNNGTLSNIFYPIGWNIGWHTGYAWLDGILSLPLQWFGVPAFYNLHVALTLWLSFMGICWMLSSALSSGSQSLSSLSNAKELNVPSPMEILIPLIAALALWTPFTFQEVSMGRPTQVYWVFSCTFVGLLWRYQQECTIAYRKRIGVGLALVASCFVYWFGGASIGLCGGVVVLCQLTMAKQKRGFVLGSLLSGGVAIGIAMIVAHSMIWDVLYGNGVFEQLQKTPLQSWSPFQLPIYNQIRIHNWHSMWSLLEDHPSTVPILGLGLFGAIAPFGWRTRWPWIVGWIVSLGIPITGALIIGDWVIPTGQSLLQWIFPLLLRCEYPDRMVVAPTVFSIGIGIHAMTAVITRFHRPIQQWLFSGCVGIILLLSLSPPTIEDLRVSSFVVDDVRLTIAEQFPGGMIDAPFSRSENTYIQQLFHKQPLLGGPGLNRVQPDAHKDYCNSNALLKSLQEMDQMGKTTHPFQPKDVEQLIADGFSVVVFDPQSKRFSAEELEVHLKTTPAYIDHRTGIRAYPLTDLLTVASP